MSVKSVKFIAQSLDNNQYTTKNEIIRFMSLINAWEFDSLGLRGSTDIVTRKNINLWLDDFELLWRNQMQSINLLSGFGGYTIANEAIDQFSDFVAYKEIYARQINVLSRVDLTEAVMLRNNLARQMRGNWQEFYNQFDEFALARAGQNLDSIKRIFIDTPEFRDNVYLLDRAGRHWEPETYANMWARTRNREIEDDIMRDECGDLGIDIVQINNVNTTTPICKQYEGKYFSLNGATPGLPILKIKPPFHPRCRHRMLPMERDRIEPLLERNKKIDREVAVARNGWTRKQKLAIIKQEKWNELNR